MYRGIKVYSQRSIQAGEELTITYLPSTFLTLPQRRTKLQNTWFFTCTCTRWAPFSPLSLLTP